MVSSIVRPFALFLPLLLVTLPGVTARAQQPKLEMHRAGVDSKDPSGWHLAVSTKGSFSVRMPIPFNDFTVRSTDPKTGEKVTIRRFSRYKMGEGLSKRDDDFQDEVAKLAGN